MIEPFPLGRLALDLPTKLEQGGDVMKNFLYAAGSGQSN